MQGTIAVGLSTAALGGLSVQASSAADAKTLVVASGADAVTLDPQVSFDGQSPPLARRSMRTWSSTRVTRWRLCRTSQRATRFPLTDLPTHSRSGRSQLFRWGAVECGGGETLD